MPHISCRKLKKNGRKCKEVNVENGRKFREL